MPDVIRNHESASPGQRYPRRPGGIPTQVAFSQDSQWPELDLDRAAGCIRDIEHAYSRDGGLAVLYGNLAEQGCIVKTAGVDESILKFAGPARIFESQDAAVEAILGDRIKAGRRGPDPLRGPQGRAACRRCCTRPAI